MQEKAKHCDGELRRNRNFGEPSTWLHSKVVIVRRRSLARKWRKRVEEEHDLLRALCRRESQIPVQGSDSRRIELHPSDGNASSTMVAKIIT